MAAPLISVVIPARNAQATLAETLDSLLRQRFQGWEAFVVDDNSTDGTAAIIADYAARDPRIRGLKGPGKGVGAARNLGIAAAGARWLHFLDADDWNDPGFYEKLLAALEAAPDAVAGFCGYRRVMPGGLIAPANRMPESMEDPFEDFVRGCLIAIHAVLVDRALVTQIGGFDVALTNCEDWDLWQRVSRFGRRWVAVNEGLAFYRTDAPSLSRNVDWLLEHSRIIIRRGFGEDPRLAGMQPRWGAGGSPARGSIEQALAYNALWTLGMDCGAGGPGKVDEDMLRPFKDAAMEAFPIATVIFEGLLVGSRSLPEQLAGRWPAYGARLTGLIGWLGEIWQDPGAARAIQYHLEERILYSEKFLEPRVLALTQSVRVDVANPPEVALAPGVDRIYACVAAGEAVQGYLTLGALGNFVRRQWLEVRSIDPRLRLRRWRQAVGSRADAIWARRSASLVLRQPGLLRRRSRLRGALKQAWQEARLEELGPIDPPGSHAAKLAEIKAWATEYARRHGQVDAVKPAERYSEDRVEVETRQQHFEELFEKEDPWNYSSAYEQQKYERQLEILPPGEVGRVLELACAEGHFTVQLAPRVGQLLATDISATALKRTEARCAGLDNIAYQVLDLAAGPIPGGMDLIFCSEVLYYLADEAELRRVAPKMVAALAEGGCLITAHGYVLHDDLSRTGFDWGTIFGAAVIHRVFSEIAELRLEKTIETELYRIDRFRKVAPDAPAAAPELKRLPVVEVLDPAVARNIVWGGAKILRDDASRDERRTQVPVLMYHGISEDGPAGLKRFRVSPEMFRAQLRWLRSNGFYSVGSEQMAEQMGNGYPFWGRPVMLTFDDGFQDFADTAWPLLAAHDFTAEMFVVTDRVGQAAIWDEKLGPPARLMDAATIARLAGEGALFGSHLATHRPVDGLSTEELARELAGSQAMLARWLGKPPVSFAAPFTITDNRLGWLAAQAGYKIGFGNGSGVARLDGDPLNLPRIVVEGDWSLEQFIARMEACL